MYQGRSWHKSVYSTATCPFPSRILHVRRSFYKRTRWDLVEVYILPDGLSVLRPLPVVRQSYHATTLVFPPIREYHGAAGVTPSPRGTIRPVGRGAAAVGGVSCLPVFALVFLGYACLCLCPLTHTVAPVRRKQPQRFHRLHNVFVLYWRRVC